MDFEIAWEGAPALEPDNDDKPTFADTPARFATEGLDNAKSETGASTTKSGKGKKKNFAAGGTNATSKKISLDYDSDDGRMVELKQQGYSNEYVSEQMQKEGRAHYTVKIVNGRWQRLRKLMMDQENERLDDELSDWHEGEDDQLLEIAQAVEKKYENERKLLEARKWNEVSMHLADKLGKRKYTGNACQERFDGVQNGTALPPIELDENPEERRQTTQARIAAAKQARQKAKDDKRDKEARDQTQKEAKKQEAIAAEQKKLNDALQKRYEKNEAERVREERIQNNNRIKIQRKAMKDQYLAEERWISTRKKAEADLYRQLTGYTINSKNPGRRRKHLRGDDEDDDIDLKDVSESENEDEDVIELPSGEEDEADAEDNSEEVMKDEPTNDEDLLPTAAKPPPAKPKNLAGYVPASVTKETLRNPRSILSIEELDRLLFSRELPRRFPNETHAQVVARLAASDEALKSEELGQLLIAIGEKSKGKKVDKIARLQEADANGSEAGVMGAFSTDLDFIRGYEGYQGGFEELIEEAEAEAEKAKADGGWDFSALEDGLNGA